MKLWGVKSLWCGAPRPLLHESTLDGIDLHRLDLNAVGLEPGHRFLDLFAVPFHLQRNDPDGRGPRGVADVEYNLKFFAHLVDERFAAAVAVEGYPKALRLAGHSGVS